MAKLTQNSVLHVAKLSKLKLSKEEVEKYLEQLSRVVEYISELETVDTSDVVATSQTTGLENVLRDDSVGSSECLSQEQALSGTENTKNGYFKVSAVLVGKDQE